LTGDIGTGKTLLIRCLLQMLRRTDVAYAYVFNSKLGPLEFLQYLAADFGLDLADKPKGALLRDLGKFLVARYQKSLETVIIVDEAHHLSTEVLEEVRLLTNLETSDQKLVQVLLVGQPELGEKLDSMEMKQLKQRVALRAHLDPMNAEETSAYIRRRVELAGAKLEAPELFPAEALARIYRHTRGVARLINTVCDNALITCFARQLESVPPAVVDEVAEDLRLNIVHHPRPEPTVANDDLAQAIRGLLKLHAELQSLGVDASASRLHN